MGGTLGVSRGFRPFRAGPYYGGVMRLNCHSNLLIIHDVQIESKSTSMSCRHLTIVTTLRGIMQEGRLTSQTKWLSDWGYGIRTSLVHCTRCLRPLFAVTRFRRRNPLPRILRLVFAITTLILKAISVKMRLFGSRGCTCQSCSQP
jgi:hypothetical protein